MILYHGSNVEVREPKLLKIQRDLDFGKGFYTTSDFEQARTWALRTVRIRNVGAAKVSCYEIDDAEISKLRVMRFIKADLSWLDFVAANRKGKNLQNDYDLVIGPVANDQTFPTILLYLDGYIDAESAIRQLLPQKLKDQWTFKTEVALACLKCKEIKQI